MPTKQMQWRWMKFVATLERLYKIFDYFVKFIAHLSGGVIPKEYV